MDEAKQRTEALKKAFADVILNLTKETAARVLASEKKAVRFQQELATCKEEALQTLLRVKCIMDSKINEKERISLDQARRIQELEIQLVEARDTIKCLETNLERVNHEMVILKNSAAQSMKKEDFPSRNGTQFEGRDENENIIQRSEPVPCSPSYEFESVSYKNVPSSLCHQTVTQKSRSLNSNKNEPDMLKAVNLNSSNVVVLANANHAKGRRAKRRSIRKARSLTSINGFVKFEPCKIPSDPDSSSEKVPEFVSPASLENPELGCEDGSQLCLLDKPLSPVVDADCRGMNTENRGSKNTGSPSNLLPHDNSRDAISSRVKFSNSNDHHSSPDGGPVSRNAKSNGVDDSKGNANRKQEELPVVNSDDRGGDDRKSVGVTSQGSGDGFLKYTFRRKRIRGSSSDAAETTDPEKSNPSKKKPSSNEDLAPETSIPLAGRHSSSDSRRIAQVARQLISLSQKRWG